MGSNYRVLVYIGNDLGVINTYHGQIINGSMIPTTVLAGMCKIEPNKKYTVEVDPEVKEITSIIREYELSEWVFGELNSINAYNKTIIKKTVKTGRHFVDIPDDIIIDQLLWDFIIATIKLGKYPLFTGPTGSGKAQPLCSKILTPNGWITMGKIKLGDKVITQSGEPTIVNGVFPQGKKEIFKISFSDGSSTMCCKEHLWNVKNFCNRNKKRGPKKNRKKIETEFQTLSIDEIKNNLIYNGTHKNYSIPIVNPVKFNKKELPLDPYFLGLLLGDGGLSQKTIHYSSEDDELLSYVDLYSRSLGCSFKSEKIKNNYIEGRITPIFRSYNNNIILKELKLLNLMGKKSEEKFIPDIYKYSSVEHRIELLKGLMDTDGSTTGISTTFHTSSKLLRNDVIEIVRSLGGIATYSSKIPKYKYLGKILEGRESYSVSISLNNINPFKLKRKADKYIQKTKYIPTRYITGIEYLDIMEAQCISVEDESHLYVTDDYIVTHNTVLSRGIAKALGYDYYYLNCGNLLKPKQTLVGTVQAREGSTYLVESEFLTKFRSDKPTIILLDELSRIPSGNSLMTVTDREQSYIYVEELGERIYKGKDVIFIATANFGIQYVDTRKLDNALMNRFIPFHLNYLDEEDEFKLINMKVPGLKASDINGLIRSANLLRENWESLGQEISHRHTIDMAAYMSIGFTYAEVVENILVNLFVNGSDDRREQVEQILNSKK